MNNLFDVNATFNAYAQSHFAQNLKTPEQKAAEGALYVSFVQSLDATTAEAIEKFQRKINELSATPDDEVKNAAAIDFYRKRIALYSRLASGQA